MYAKKSDRFGRKLFARAAACLFALGAMSAYCDGAVAEQRSVSPRPLQARVSVVGVADLENAFWRCDYVATTRGVHATPIDVCVTVTDELKNQRFGGDFEEMLKWWRQNKLAEHQKVGNGDR